MNIKYLALMLVLMLFGCSEEKTPDISSGSEGAGKPIVFVSNYPLQYMAENISAPLVDIRFPVPAGEDPAFWKPSPKDVLSMQQADLVILNGASYESWLNNVSLSSSKLVDTSVQFRDRLIVQDEMATHSHGLDGEHEHSATAFTTWLDLTLAVEQGRVIAHAFSVRWPDRAEQIKAQFGMLVQELEAMDGEIKEIVSRNPDIPVLFSHPVYQYFSNRYGLNGRSLHWEPEEMPSEAMWQELTELLEQHPAKWMIWEGKPSTATVERLASMGIQSVVFNPCSRTPDSGDFNKVMRMNIEALKPVFDQP